ncbi:hypothetical protein HDU83_001220 [Entophlyctis luteolus]|nr:hypothetical protein HDU83_001220 [Entophlyctis luteolus]
MLSFAAAASSKDRRAASPSPSRGAFRAPAYLTATATAGAAAPPAHAAHPTHLGFDSRGPSFDVDDSAGAAAVGASIVRSPSHYLPARALQAVSPFDRRSISPPPAAPSPPPPRASIEWPTLSTRSSAAALSLPRRPVPAAPPHSNQLAMAASRTFSQRPFRVSSPPAPPTSTAFHPQPPLVHDAAQKSFFNLFGSLRPSSATGFSPPEHYHSGSVFQFSEGRAAHSDVDEMNERSSGSATDDQEDDDNDCSLDHPPLNVDDAGDNVPLFASLPRGRLFRSTTKQPPASPPNKQVFQDISPADAKPSKHNNNVKKSSIDDDEAPLGMILMQQKQQQLQQQQEQQHQQPQLQQSHLSNSRVKSPMRRHDSEDDDLPLARFQAEHTAASLDRPDRRPTRTRRKSSAQQSLQQQLQQFSVEAANHPLPKMDEKQLTSKLSPVRMPATHPRRITTRIYIDSSKSYKTVILSDTLQADAVISELFAVAGNSISRDNIDDSIDPRKIIKSFTAQLTEFIKSIIGKWPKVEGRLDVEIKPGKFRPRYVSLREDAIFSKERESERETLLCRLSHFDVYTLISPRKRATTQFAFALRSTKDLTIFENSDEYVHFFCADSNEQLTDWVFGIRLAKSEAMFAERPDLFTEYENIPARSAPPLRQPLSLGHSAIGQSGAKLLQDLNSENVVIPSNSLIGRSLSVVRKPVDVTTQPQQTLLSFSPKMPEKQENSIQTSRQVDKAESMKNANKPLLSFETEMHKESQPVAQQPLRRAGTTLLTFPSQKRAFSNPLLAEVDNTFAMDSAVFEACDMPLSTTQTSIEAYDEATLREIQRFLNRAWEDEMASVAADLEDISKQMQLKSATSAAVNPQEAMSPTSQKLMSSGGESRSKLKQKQFSPQEMDPGIDFPAKASSAAAKAHNANRAQAALGVSQNKGPTVAAPQLHRSRSQRITGSGTTAFASQFYSSGAGGGGKIGNSGPLVDLGDVHNCTVCGCSEFKTIFGQNGVVMRDGRKEFQTQGEQRKLHGVPGEIIRNNEQFSKKFDMGSCASKQSEPFASADNTTTRDAENRNEKKQDAAAAAKAAKKSKQIDKQLAETNKEESIKILLLARALSLLRAAMLSFNLEMLRHQSFDFTGTAEAGKSTVLKQLRIIHGGGFSNTDIEVYRCAVRRNIYDTTRSLTEAMRILRIPYGFDAAAATSSSACAASRVSLTEGSRMLLLPVAQEGHSKFQDLVASDAARIYESRGEFGSMSNAETIDAIRKAVSCFRAPTVDFSAPLGADTVAAVKLLWADTGIRYCFSRANEFCSLTYTPTNQDILSLRIMTSGVYETIVVIDKNVFKVYDVGGQKSERRKWIHVFDNVTAIFFLFDTSAYNQFTAEDASVNRITEAIAVFSFISSHAAFKTTTIMVFLNKVDLLKEKLSDRNPISLYFPEYTGENEYKTVVQFYIDKINESNGASDRQLFFHLTQANDTEKMKAVLTTVVDSIVV